MGREFNVEDTAKVAQWCQWVHRQRFRLNLVKSMVALDDPEALTAQAPVERNHTPTDLVKSMVAAK